MQAESRLRQFLDKWVYRWEIIPLISIFVINLIIYSGSGIMTAGWRHVDLTTEFDRAVPFWPGFIWIYLLAYPVWAVGYVLAAQNGKDRFYRFVATDLTIHFICLVCFLVMPTTNVRPEVTGNSFSEWALRLVYRIDGNDLPGNLFPSIHCYVSWLGWRAVREAKKLPRWFSPAYLVMAVLIIISTQVLKQHYIADAISGVLLVEIFWRFYRTGERHMPFYRFFEAVNNKFWKGKQDV